MMTKQATSRKAATLVLLGLGLLMTNGCACVGPGAPLFPLMSYPAMGCGDVCGDPCGDVCGDPRGDPCGTCGGPYCYRPVLNLIGRPVFGALGIFREVLTAVTGCAGGGCGGVYVDEWISDPPGPDPCCGAYYHGSASDAFKPPIRPNIAGIRYGGCATCGTSSGRLASTGTCRDCGNVAVSDQPIPAGDADVTDELATRRTVSPRHRPYRAASHVRQAVRRY